MDLLGPVRDGPLPSPSAFPESRGLQGHPPGTLSAPMIVTAQPALPTYIEQGRQTLLRPAARRSGPAWPPGSPDISAGRRSASRTSRTSRSPREKGPPHPQSHNCSSRQVHRRFRPLLPRAEQSSKTSTNAALISLPLTAVPLAAFRAPLRRHSQPHRLISLEAT